MSLVTAQDDWDTARLQQLIDQNAHSLMATDPTAWFPALEVGPQVFTALVIVLIRK